MIVVGDARFEFEKLTPVSNIEELQKTTPNSTVLLLNEDFEFQKYLAQNNIAYAIKIDSIKSAIYANNLKASYLICDFDLAKEVQKLAENYLFDAKILAIIYNESEIEHVAKSYVDGVIYLNKLLEKL